MRRTISGSHETLKIVRVNEKILGKMMNNALKKVNMRVLRMETRTVKII